MNRLKLSMFPVIMMFLLEGCATLKYDAHQEISGVNIDTSRLRKTDLELGIDITYSPDINLDNLASKDLAVEVKQLLLETMKGNLFKKVGEVSHPSERSQYDLNLIGTIKYLEVKTPGISGASIYGVTEHYMIKKDIIAEAIISFKLIDQKTGKLIWINDFKEVGTTKVTLANRNKAITNVITKALTSLLNDSTFPEALVAFNNEKTALTGSLAGKGEASVLTIIKSDVDDLPSKKVKVNNNAHAIVIGIEQYRQKLPKADFATSDAETVTKYLTKVMGYPEENVVTLTNDKASKSDFEKYFGKWLSNNVEKGGTVFVYYSGHGAPNPKTGDAFLVPYDGDPAFIDETGYPLSKLYEQLGKLPAKEIIVALDSCFSGAGGRSVIAKGARPLVMNMKANAIPPNVAVLSASSGEQISSTYDEKGHGLFTYFMLKGLKGEAETNGSVDIGNLFEYIRPQVEGVARKQYNNEQTPQLIAPKELTGIRLR